MSLKGKRNCAIRKFRLSVFRKIQSLKAHLFMMYDRQVFSIWGKYNSHFY